MSDWAKLNTRAALLEQLLLLASAEGPPPKGRPFPPAWVLKHARKALDVQLLLRAPIGNAARRRAWEKQVAAWEAQAPPAKQRSIDAAAWALYSER